MGDDLMDQLGAQSVQGRLAGGAKAWACRAVAPRFAAGAKAGYAQREVETTSGSSEAGELVVFSQVASARMTGLLPSPDPRWRVTAQGVRPPTVICTHLDTPSSTTAYTLTCQL